MKRSRSDVRGGGRGRIPITAREPERNIGLGGGASKTLFCKGGKAKEDGGEAP